MFEAHLPVAVLIVGIDSQEKRQTCFVSVCIQVYFKMAPKVVVTCDIDGFNTGSD